MSAPTVCNEPGCPTIVRVGNRCHAHRAEGHVRHGSTRAWRKLRAAVLYRDAYTCQYCGRAATHADHVIPRVAGGRDTAANLVAACEACNLAKGDGPGPPPRVGPQVGADLADTPQRSRCVYGSPKAVL